MADKNDKSTNAGAGQQTAASTPAGSGSLVSSTNTDTTATVPVTTKPTAKERRAAAVAANARKTAAYKPPSGATGHVSSAYGAPFLPGLASPSGGSPRVPRARSDIVNSMQGVGGRATSENERHGLQQQRGHGPSILSQSAKPKDGSSKDTSVNIATAFRSAAGTPAASTSVHMSTSGAANFLGRAGDRQPVASAQSTQYLARPIASTSAVVAGTNDDSFESLPEATTENGTSGAKKRKKPSTSTSAANTSKTKETASYRPSKKELQAISSDEFDSDGGSVDLDELRFELGDGPAKTILPSSLQQASGQKRKKRRPAKKAKTNAEDEEEDEEDESADEELESEEDDQEQENVSPAKQKNSAVRRKSGVSDSDGVYKPNLDEGEESDVTNNSPRRRTNKGKSIRAPGRALRDNSVLSEDGPAQSVTSFYLHAPTGEAADDLGELVQTNPRSQNYQPHFAYSTQRINGQQQQQASTSTSVPAILRARKPEDDTTSSQISGQGGHNESSNYSFDQRGSDYGYENEDAYVRAIELQDQSKRQPIPVGRQFKEKQREISLDPTPSERSVDSLTVPQPQQHQHQHPRKAPAPPGPNGRARSRSPSLLSDTGARTASLPAVAKGNISRRVGEVVRALLTMAYWATVKPLLWLRDAETSKMWKWAAVIAFIGLILGSVREHASQPSSPSSSWYFPPFGTPARHPSSTFDVPVALPSNFDELVHRLSSLESSVATLSHTQSSEQATASELAHQQSSTFKRLAVLEVDFENERDKSSKVQDNLVRMGQKDAKELENGLRGVRTQLDNLSEKLNAMSTGRKQDTVALTRYQGELDSVSKDISRLSQRMDAVTTEIREASAKEHERVRQIALVAIEDLLPSRMAVSVDQKSGKVKIDPAFWTHLRSAFAEAGSQATAAGASTGLVTWNDFLATNDKNLRGFVAEDVDARIGSGAVLSKKSFLELLEREIAALKLNMSTSTSDALARLSTDLSERMDKVAASASLVSAARGKPTAIKLSSGEDLNGIVSGLITSALDRYSKDVLGQPDFALYSAGGRVIPSLTSPTYEVRPAGWGSSLVAGLTGMGTIRGKPPVTALHPDISVGQCWPFAGHVGQIGILLSRNILPTDITIEHASKDVALDVSSAPKGFEVYGLVEDKAGLERLNALQALSEEPLSNQLLLTEGVYDIYADSHIQTFPIPQAVRNLDIPVGVILLRILENHGNKALSCLYRIRVGGTVVSEN